MASWQNTSLLMLRTMLNDAGCGESKYSNNRLEDLLITAAYFIPIDVNFNSTYVVDVEAYTITPDPIGQSDGAEFINFMVLKAACIADEGNFRNSALLQGVTARCGPAVLNTNSYGQYLNELLTNGPCKVYQDVSSDYNFSYEGKKIIRAIMSPFVSNDFYPPMGDTGGADRQGPNNVYWF